ncbi:amidohydrolase family protein [Chelativorans xinjiangense]|uniref:amidohydrolase family protein n=1 Tax=Chelativorans xinjiangense TaxID=2681485 RepID=UPI00248444DB|nr:amidohydrolase family protein [Chelativorans xinjiangense]
MPDQCPSYYRDSLATEAIEGTGALIEYIRNHPDNHEGLVRPVITPRFIPSCTDAALEGLGALARECGCHVQTHCSESDWEHEYVLHRYGVTDAAALARFGLLGRHSVLAHGNFVTTEDIETIGARKAAVAHCPLSNIYFANAVFPLRAVLEKNIHVGLGTDISGGPSSSLFESMRAAVLASRMLESGTDPDLPPERRSLRAASRIDFRHAFYLATTGGGVALGLPIGLFAPGYHFDAIAVDTAAVTGMIRLWDDLDSGELVLQKIVYTASRSNIAAVWIGGMQAPRQP